MIDPFWQREIDFMLRSGEACGVRISQAANNTQVKAWTSARDRWLDKAVQLEQAVKDRQMDKAWLLIQ